MHVKCTFLHKPCKGSRLHKAVSPCPHYRMEPCLNTQRIYTIPQFTRVTTYMAELICSLATKSDGFTYRPHAEQILKLWITAVSAIQGNCAFIPSNFKCKCQSLSFQAFFAIPLLKNENDGMKKHAVRSS